MPRYFFDLVEPCGVLTDPDGRVLTNPVAAQVAAIVDARAIMAAEIGNGRLLLDCSIVIRNEQHVGIGTVEFRDVIVVEGRLI